MQRWIAEGLLNYSCGGAWALSPAFGAGFFRLLRARDRTQGGSPAAGNLRSRAWSDRWCRTAVTEGQAGSVIRGSWSRRLSIWAGSERVGAGGRIGGGPRVAEPGLRAVQRFGR